MRVLLAAALLVAACGGSATPASSPSEGPSVHSSPDPNLIDVMMGNVPQATAFVVSGAEVLAVTLLNHFVRYRVPVADAPQLATSPDGALLYVADHPREGLRLRAFDVLTGRQRLERLAAGRLLDTRSSRGALVATGQRLYALQEDGGQIAAFAYDAIGLESRARIGAPGCVDLLVASADAAYAVCRSSGEVFRVPPADARVVSVGALAGGAVSFDGTLGFVSGSGSLRTVARGAQTATEIVPDGWVNAPASSDGLAWSDATTLVYLEEGATSRVHVVDVVSLLWRWFELPTAFAADGILARGQFAYWVAGDASGVYHLDLQSGLVEKMYGPLVKGARLGALSIR